jgi:hypothetical protein
VRTVWDIIGLTIFVAAALWLGLIALVGPDRKPVVACAPLHYTFGVIHRALRASDGAELLVPREAGLRSAGDRATLACVAFVDRYVHAAGERR